MSGADPNEPSAETMLETMRQENEQLRNRLVETERDYIRITRLNEIYREELIEHRRRVSHILSGVHLLVFTRLYLFESLDWLWTT